MPILKKVNVRKYSLERLEGLTAIFSFTEGRKFEPVTLVDFEKIRAWWDKDRPHWSEYGESLDWVDEAFEFGADRVLVCAHVTQWNGTFQDASSHVRYYGLRK
jgi:hypothetical protein